MDNEYKNTPFQDEDDYSLIKDDMPLGNAADDLPTLNVKKQSRKKASSIKNNIDIIMPLSNSDLSVSGEKAAPLRAPKKQSKKKQPPEKVIDLTNDYISEEIIEAIVSEHEMMTNDAVTVEPSQSPIILENEAQPITKTCTTKNTYSSSQNTLNEHASHSTSEENADDMTLPEDISRNTTNQTVNLTNQKTLLEQAAEEEIITSTTKATPLEKIRITIQTFVASKGSNWLFAFGLILLIGAFLLFKFHQLSMLHSKATHPQTNMESSLSSLNQPVSNTSQTASNSIPVAGEGVIPDDNGFTSSDTVTSNVTTPAPLTNNVNQDQMADLNKKIDLVNSKLDAMQSSIEAIQTQLSPPVAPTPIPVKVLGVLQNQRDDKWHADVLVKGQVFDVVTGDTAAGVHFVNVSGSGVDYQNAP